MYPNAPNPPNVRNKDLFIFFRIIFTCISAPNRHKFG